MNKDSRIYIAGHTGLLGSAIEKVLSARGYTNFITATHGQVDLTDASETMNFFNLHRPEYVFMCAGHVGGIEANANYKGAFIYKNLMMQCNIVEACRIYGVQKLCLPMSSCMYPKDKCRTYHILEEEDLMEWKPEETNDAYAIAKLAGYYLCRAYREQYRLDFVAPVLTNLYGDNDNFDKKKGHVIGSLITKFVEAREKSSHEIELLGTGDVMREFLHADDAARILIELMNISAYGEQRLINVGSGDEWSIKQLASMIAKEVEYKGRVSFDGRKIMNGVERKRLDLSTLEKFGLASSKLLINALPVIIKAFISNKK